MLVAPFYLALCELLAIRWSRRRVCDLRDQVCCRCLRNTVYQNTEKRDLEEDIETNAKAKQEAFTVMEPRLLLGRSETNAGEVRL